jgi:hypothetical protein
MKRALLIGIDEYDDFDPLAGCEDDVARLHPLLSRNEDDSPNFTCRVLTRGVAPVTRRRILQELDALFAPGADVALLYFAGHGWADQKDVVLVSEDGDESDPGVPASEIFKKIAASKVGEVIVILDCCFAGAAGAVPQLLGDVSALRLGTCLLAASRHDQPVEEASAGRGVFSAYLAGALEGGAADVIGEVSLAGIFAYLSQSFGAWDQKPMCKMNVDRSNELRRCAPSVPLPELRRLPDIFPDPELDLPLDPSYEPTAEPEHPAHEADFATLQRYRASKLVNPVGAEHLYFAAMQNGACRLTPLGKHYWRMAVAGRI